MPNIVNQILFDELKQDFQNMGSCVVVDVGPVNPKQDIEIRAKLREAGASYKVVRNRLAKRAFAEVGLDMAEAITGRCGIAVAENEGAIGAAKALRDWINATKNSPIAIKGGVIEGATFVGAAAAEIAELPDRDTINTMLVCAISGPARGLAGVVNAVAGGLARCIQAKVDKGE
ncbi:MAG TPA: 50S ribosomal protein L10 [Planctomycetes bacterium]|nr:50S ribosomal protein L10 [Planctomycetota bacterium]